MILSRRDIREALAILVVILHILLVFYSLFALSGRITRVETLISTCAAFFPVFGIYVGIVVKNISVRRDTPGPSVSRAFTIILVLLLGAYVFGIVSVVEGFRAGIIPSEELLPGAIGAIETAFGGFFSTMFFRLFGTLDE